MPLEIRPAGAPRTYCLSGELDLLTAGEVEARLLPDSKTPGDLVLDLTKLTFMDSTGIRQLLRTAERMDGRGRLILRSPNRKVQSVLSLIGLTRASSGIVVEGEQDPAWGKAAARTFAAESAMLTQVRAFIRHRAVEDSFGEWVDSIELAVSEAAANSVIHSGAPEVHVTWRPYADHAEVEVRDSGVFKRAFSPDPESGGNRGFLLMMSLMDQISITCGTDAHPGTVVRMVKQRNGGRRRFLAPGGASRRPGFPSSATPPRSAVPASGRP